MIEPMRVACPKCKQMVDVPVDMDETDFMRLLMDGELRSLRAAGAIRDRLASECMYLDTMRHEGR